MGGSCSRLRPKAKAKKEAKAPTSTEDKKVDSVQTPPAKQPSQYLQEDLKVDQGNKAPTEPAKENVEMSVKQFVDSTIKNNKVVVWSKSYCPYCKKAKHAIFSIVPVDEVEVVELDLHPMGDEIQDYLKDITGGRSVPRVFINGKFIGGGDDAVAKMKSGDDTVAKLKSGELEKLLKEAGVKTKAVAA